MEQETTLFNISHCLFSSLCQQFILNEGNQGGDLEGLLLGNILTHRIEHFEDSESNPTTISTSLTSSDAPIASSSNTAGFKTLKKIDIQKYIPLDSAFSFYDHSSAVQVEKLNKMRNTYQIFNKNPTLEIVGWFRFRRQTTVIETMRERIVHEQLAQILQPNEPCKFLFGLFTLEHPDPKDLFKLFYKFLTLPYHFRDEKQKKAFDLLQIPYFPQLQPVRIHITSLVEETQQETIKEANGNTLTLCKQYQDPSFLSILNPSISFPMNEALLQNIQDNSIQNVKLIEKYYHDSIHALKEIASKTIESRVRLQQKQYQLEKLRRSVSELEKQQNCST